MYIRLSRSTVHNISDKYWRANILHINPDTIRNGQFLNSYTPDKHRLNNSDGRDILIEIH